MRPRPAHHDKDAALVFLNVDDRADVRVVQRCCRLGFLDQLLGFDRKLVKTHISSLKFDGYPANFSVNIKIYRLYSKHSFIDVNFVGHGRYSKFLIDLNVWIQYNKNN